MKPMKGMARRPLRPKAPELRGRDRGEWQPPKREYDPITCVTAGEVRASGFPLPDDLPDVAWIARKAVRWSSGNCEFRNGVALAPLQVVFDEPWRWTR